MFRFPSASLSCCTKARNLSTSLRLETCYQAPGFLFLCVSKRLSDLAQTQNHLGNCAHRTTGFTWFINTVSFRWRESNCFPSSRCFSDLLPQWQEMIFPVITMLRLRTSSKTKLLDKNIFKIESKRHHVRTIKKTIKVVDLFFDTHPLLHYPLLYFRLHICVNKLLLWPDSPPKIATNQITINQLWNKINQWVFIIPFTPKFETNLRLNGNGCFFFYYFLRFFP